MTVLPGIVSFNGTVLRNCSRFSIYPDKLVLRILSVPTVVITPEMMNEAPRFDDNTIVFDISYCGRMATVKLTTLDNRELAVMLNAWQQGNIEKIKTKIVYDPCHLKPVRRNLLIIKVAISGVLGCFAGALIGMSILRLIGLLPFIRIGDMEISGNLLGLLLAPLMGILSARSTYHAEMKKANTEQ